jgi:hypothetical protein
MWVMIGQGKDGRKSYRSANQFIQRVRVCEGQHGHTPSHPPTPPSIHAAKEKPSKAAKKRATAVVSEPECPPGMMRVPVESRPHTTAEPISGPPGVPTAATPGTSGGSMSSGGVSVARVAETV